MTDSMVRLSELIQPAKTVRAGGRTYPILSMTMHDGLVDQATKFRKRIASADTSPYKVVRRDQLVVGFPIDEGVLAFQRLHDAAIVSPAYDIWDIGDAQQVEPLYLERFLRSPIALAYYRAKLRGTTARRRSIPDEVFLRLPVHLPPLPEQRRIAAILDRADELRVKRRAAIAQLDTLAQSIFLDMFGDPVTNPKQFPKLRLSEFGDVVTGNTPPRASAEFYGGQLEWIKSDNLSSGSYYAQRAAETLSDSGRLEGRLAPPGSILVTCIAGSRESIGNAAMLDREAAFNQQINALVPLVGNPHFLFAQFRTAKQLVQAASTDSMKGMVSKSRFEAIEFIDPPRDLQDRFAVIALGLHESKSVGMTASVGLDHLFASLQHGAFHGKV